MIVNAALANMMQRNVDGAEITRLAGTQTCPPQQLKQRGLRKFRRAAGAAIHRIDNAAELLRGLRCKVNLIALNPGPGIDFTTPGGDRVAAFQKILREAGIPAYVRRPRGRDIYAACGQLKRTVEIPLSSGGTPASAT